MVPSKRLLIQPTVQLKWLEQHGTIEFVLEEVMLQRFETLWLLLCERNIAFREFLISADALAWTLHNDDTLFALLTGADYISQRYPSFEVQIQSGRLIWSIAL